MIVRPLAPRIPPPSTNLALLFNKTCTSSIARRFAHAYPPRPVPEPTPFVPDVPTFLRLIGRQLSAHASKIESWNALFALSSAQLRDLGVEPPRARRYLIWWREKFRRGEFGVGGDLKHVGPDGVAEIRLLERGEGLRPLAVNAPPPAHEGASVDLEAGSTVKGMKVKEPGIVVGKYLKPVKGTHGTVGRLEAEDGMWEVKRGKKILGGERQRKYNLSVLRRKAKEAAK